MWLPSRSARRSGVGWAVGVSLAAHALLATLAWRQPPGIDAPVRSHEPVEVSVLGMAPADGATRKRGQAEKARELDTLPRQRAAPVAARAPARTDASGRFVPLAEQDPARWDQHLISRAHGHLRAAHARGQLGRFQLEAAIQAVHCARGRGGATDWAALLPLHRVLHAVAPTLGSGIALAAVTAETNGPAAGLALLDQLLAEAGPPARRFQPARATRAHLLDRLGRGQEAVAAYESAISLTHDIAERRYLEHCRDRVGRQDRKYRPSLRSDRRGV